MYKSEIFRKYINNLSISPEQREKEKAQLEYTETHINNVLKAWELIKESESCIDIINSQISKARLAQVTLTNEIPCPYTSLIPVIEFMDHQIRLHDLSKYSEIEWEAYRRNFYPINDQEKEKYKEDFDKAWLHHYTINTHHWNYWYKIRKDINAMDLLSCIELCCDWIAMNFVFDGTALDFYEKNVLQCTDPNEKIYLGEKQSSFILNLLTAFYKDFPKPSK